MPAISVSSSARRRRSMAAPRSPAWTMTLATGCRTRAGPGRRPRDPVSTRTPGPAGMTQRSDPARASGAKSRAGSSAASRTSMAWPTARRHARQRPRRRPTAARPRPAGTARGRCRCPATSSVTPCSTWSRVLTSRKWNGPVRRPAGTRRSRRSGARRPSRPGPPGRGGGGARPSSARAPAPPRRASGGVAGASSRAPRWRRRGRSRRRAAGPRCVGPAGSRARGRPRRRRRPRPPRPSRRPAPRAGRPGAATRRIPRPPPPAAALTSSGKPIRSASARIAGERVGPVDRDRLEGARHGLDPDRPREPARPELVAERLDDRGRRADEHEPGLLDGPGERRALGEEPVAGMDRLGAGRPRGLDDRVDAEVALGRRRAGRSGPRVGQPDVQGVGVGVAVDGDRFHAEFVAGPDDPDGDLAAVGDQDATEWRTGRRHRRGRVFAQRRAVAATGSERDVAMLLSRVRVALVGQHLQRPDQPRPRLGRPDDVVDIAARRRDVRVRELRLVGRDQSRPLRLGSAAAASSSR